MTNSTPSTIQSTLMWTEKYRPSTLSELVSSDEKVHVIEKLVRDKERMPHLLFYGPPGTGKTSTILAIARQLYRSPQQLKTHVLELNASDSRGIDVIREKIKVFASTQQLFSSGMKLIILDEADQMTMEAQAALRRTIEQFAQNTRFCIICNYINKISAAIQSRCTKFRFAPLHPDKISVQLERVVLEEGIQANKRGIEAIVRICQGDMRKALMIMQGTVASRGDITENGVYESTGTPLPDHIQEIVASLLNDHFHESYTRIRTMQTDLGYAMQDILHEVFLFSTRLRLPSDLVSYLIDQMSTIQQRITHGASEKIQLSALIGIFHLAREAIGRDVSLDDILSEDVALRMSGEFDFEDYNSDTTTQQR